MDESYWINLCSGLGTIYSVKGKAQRFIKNEAKCIKSLKRIRKEINADNREEKNDSVILFGDIGLMKNYLIPLALSYGSEDEKLLVEVAKIVVQLTMPLGPADSKNASKRMHHLRVFKSEFMASGVMHSFLHLLENPLSSGSSIRKTEDKLLVELVLWLLRNLLAIPDANPTTGGSTKNAHFFHLHEDFLLMLDREGITDLVMFLGEYVGGEGNREWNLLLLEVFYHLFRGVRTEDLSNRFVSSPNTTSDVELRLPSHGEGAIQGTTLQKLTHASEKLDDELASMMLKSRAKRVMASKSISSRHSGFAGLLKITDKSGSNISHGLATNAFAAKENKTSAKLDGISSSKRGVKKKIGAEMQQQKQQEILLGYSSSDRHVSSKLLRKVQAQICSKFIEKVYKGLFTGLKRDISRQAVLPSDIIQFYWLVALCTGYERSRVENAEQFAWHLSPIITTMDKWTFQNVLKTCLLYEEMRNFRELEITVWAFKEMVHFIVSMQSSKLPEVLNFSEKHRNMVFHEIGGELDLVPRFIRTWTQANCSWRHLATLVVLGELLVRISVLLEQDNVVVRHRGRKNTKKGKSGKVHSKTGKGWSKEELIALVEAVKSFGGGNAKNFRRALKDPTFSQIFDPSRDYLMLVHRWDQMTKTMKDVGASSIEEMLESPDLLFDANDESAGESDTEDKDEVDEDDFEEQNLEKQVESEGVLRTYANNNVMRNVVELLDPRRVPSHVSESVLSELHESVITPLIEHAHDQFPGMMWHISYFVIFSRSLQAYENKRPKLCGLLKKIIIEFFAHAETNTLAFVELLLWRNKSENVLMLNSYEDPAARRARLEEERERAYEAKLKSIHKKQSNGSSSDENSEEEADEGEPSSEDESVASDEEDEEKMKKRKERKEKKLKKLEKRRERRERKKRERRDSDLDEQEADLDNIGFFGRTKKSKLGAKTLRKKEVELEPEEAREFVEMALSLYSDAKNTDADVALSLEDHFGSSKRSVEDIRLLLDRLRLRPALPVNFLNVTVSDFKNSQASALIHAIIGTGEIQSLRWVSQSMQDGSEMLLPVTDEEFSWLQNPLFCRCLCSFGFLKDERSGYWKTSEENAWFLKAELETLIDDVLTRDSRDGLPSIVGDDEDDDDDTTVENFLDYDESLDLML